MRPESSQWREKGIPFATMRSERRLADVVKRRPGLEAFADRCPGFCWTLLQGPTPEAAQTLVAIEQGRPWLRPLACRLGVAPGAIRSLATLPLGGYDDLGDLLSLAPLIDALDPSTQPRSVEDWPRLFSAVRDLAIPSPGGRQSLLVRSWLRDCMLDRNWVFLGGMGAVENAPFSVDAVESVQDMRNDWWHTLLDPGSQPMHAGSHYAYLRGLRALDRFLCKQGHRRMIQIAQRWRTRWGNETTSSSVGGSGTTAIRGFPTIVEGYFVSRERVLVPLLTPEDLVVEGLLANNCLAKYSARCKSGASILFSVRNRHTGRACSNVEFEIRRQWNGHLELVVLQHRGHGNTSPRADCSQAVDDMLLASKKDPIRSRIVAG